MTHILTAVVRNTIYNTDSTAPTNLNATNLLTTPIDVARHLNLNP